ncbi:phosphate ABC transporter permease subunit PstC [Streptomyces sp. CdTB01]|uniref:phosphate ABC transporter permease subunit PstC n=1 Tax=Streptomyces sp. CdTB01 TaxID=1725411 RepID=UPI000A5A0927|nr:phosphate ABC transporter permease subunit PstC [Streptomyces sp. CdTB01]
MSGESPTVAEPSGRADGRPSPGTPVSGLLKHPRRASGRGDRVFRRTTVGAAVFLLLLMGAIAAFLLTQALHAITADHANFLTAFEWNPDEDPSVWGVALVAWGTLVTSLFALVIGAPVAIGAALFITQYAPRRLAQALGYIVDLLAAVPSVVYGLWGIIFLVPHMGGVSTFVDAVLGWIPLFSYDGSPAPRSVFAAGIVLAIMILPIIAALSREIFLQTPHETQEAAYALGATRWEMIRLAVLPHARSGVISAVVLGFGRALGETIAVAMVLSQTQTFFTHFLNPGGNTIAANIAIQFKNAFGIGRGALIASGLVLFVMTLLMNYLARWIARRGSLDRRSPAPETASRAPVLAADASAEELHHLLDAAPHTTPDPQDRLSTPLASTARTSVGRRIRDRAAQGLATAAFTAAVLPLASILWLVIGHGAKRFDTVFLNNSMRNIAESDQGGGAYHAILGTLEQAGIATLIAVPLGVLVAVYLVEYGRGPLARMVTFVVDVMMGLPSIVAGLFILSLWILAFGFQDSGFAGSLALVILMLPMVIRSCEETIKLVPDALREAAYALGAPRRRTIMRVVLPTALPGMVTGIMLGIARVMGETAPVLLVVGFTSSINFNPFSGAQGSLPAFIYNEATQPYAPAIDRAWAGALTLILIIMLLNLAARLIAWWKRPGRV